MSELSPSAEQHPPGPAQRARRPLSERQRGVFLTHLSSGWSAKHAAEAAGRNVRRFYDLREADGEFAEAWSRAVESGTQVLEDEARRRALDGWDDPVFQQGQLVGHVRRYSDRLLEFLLRGRRPAVYRDSASTLAVSGVVGVAAAIEDRSASLADVARVLRDVGAFEGMEFPPRLALPAGDVIDHDDDGGS